MNRILNDTGLKSAAAPSKVLGKKINCQSNPAGFMASGLLSFTQLTVEIEIIGK